MNLKDAMELCKTGNEGSILRRKCWYQEVLDDNLSTLGFVFVKGREIKASFGVMVEALGQDFRFNVVDHFDEICHAKRFGYICRLSSLPLEYNEPLFEKLFDIESFHATDWEVIRTFDKELLELS